MYLLCGIFHFIKSVFVVVCSWGKHHKTVNPMTQECPFTGGQLHIKTMGRKTFSKFCGIADPITDMLFKWSF